MLEGIVVFIIGVVCVVIGILNMLGNISTIHSYHRNNVPEEKKKLFGKKVGLGTIIIGISMIVFGLLLIVASLTQNQVFIKVGTGIMFVGIAIGLYISLRAIKKFNKTIF